MGNLCSTAHQFSNYMLHFHSDMMVWLKKVFTLNRVPMEIIKINNMSVSDVVLENFLIKIVLSLLVVHSIVFGDKNSNDIFQFPEFDYKETSKNVSCINNLYTYVYLQFIDFSQAFKIL